MSAERLRALRRIVAELEEEPEAGEALVQAQALLAFYAGRAQREDNLTGPWEPPVRRAPKTPYKRRQRPKMSFAKEWALSILRESLGPVSATYVRQRLAEEYKPLTRQAVSYALRQLVNAGLAERISAPSDSPLRFLWRPTDRGG